MQAEGYLNQLPTECPDDGRKFRIILGPSCTNRDTGADGYMTISFLEYPVNKIIFRPILGDQNQNAGSSQAGEGSTNWRSMKASQLASPTDPTAIFLHSLASELSQILRTEYYGFIRKVLKQPGYDEIFVALREHYFLPRGSTSIYSTPSPSYVGLPSKFSNVHLKSLEAEWGSSVLARLRDELESRGASFCSNPAANSSKYPEPSAHKGVSHLLVKVHATIDAQLPNAMQFRFDIAAGFWMEHDVNAHVYMSSSTHASSWSESLKAPSSNFVSAPRTSILRSDHPHTSIIDTHPTLNDVMTSYTSAGPSVNTRDSRKKKRDCFGWWPRKGGKKPPTNPSLPTGGESVELDVLTAGGSLQPAGSSQGTAPP
jgi:hypothetical protein